VSASPQPELFLKAISAGSHTVADLTQVLDSSPDEIREQLRILEALGLVTRSGAELSNYALSRTGHRALEVSFLAVA
jgi:predicted transcriptional regulator